MNQPRKLYSAEFISLIFILFFGFCNMSVFYSFYGYLERLGISAEWRGIIVGLEPMTAFFLRPAVGVLIHAGNAVGFLRFSMILLALTLCAYTVTVSLPGLILLRICHGAAFVTLVSAGVAMLVHFIPPEKSTQGFGIMSLASLIPYAVAPMLTEIALRHFRNEAAHLCPGFNPGHPRNRTYLRRWAPDPEHVWQNGPGLLAASGNRPGMAKYPPDSGNPDSFHESSRILHLCHCFLFHQIVSGGP